MYDITILRAKINESYNLEDLYDLAQCYDIVNQFGNPNPYFNNFRRIYWYLKAGMNGHAEAYNNLAYIIEHELNVKNGEKRALAYYKKSSDMGSVLGKENYLLSLKIKKQQ